MDASSRSPKRLLLCLFFLSLAVRALVVVPVAGQKTPPKFDELAYYRRGLALASILESLTHFRAPAESDAAIFYGRGIQPPFQPVVLGLGMGLFGRSVTVARLLMVFLSALTTVLVFLVAARIAGPKAGLPAALLHAVYPSFIAFSHYLWSETTYILLLFLALHTALCIPELAPGRKRVGLSLLLGAVLGGMALTRAAAVLTVFVLPAWVFFRTKAGRARVVSLGLIGAALFLTVLPWEHRLYTQEKRFVLLSTFAFRNMYFGHNPWQGREQADANEETEDRAGVFLREYSRDRSITTEQGARELGFREILSRPWAAVARAAREFLFLWTFDFFPLRHLVNAVYAPLAGVWVFVCLLAFIAAALVFDLLVLKGILARGMRLAEAAMIAALVAAGTIPYLAAFGNTRFNLPQVALLLPVAGLGLARFRERTPAFAPLAAVAVLSLGALFYWSYPAAVAPSLRPSGFYAGPAGALDRIFGTESLFGDTFILRKSGPGFKDTLTLTIAGEDAGYSFDSRAPVNKLVIRLPLNREQSPFGVYGRGLHVPLAITIFSERLNKEIAVKPLTRSFWNRFQTTGLPGLDLNWRGGR